MRNESIELHKPHDTTPIQSEQPQRSSPQYHDTAHHQPSPDGLGAPEASTDYSDLAALFE